MATACLHALDHHVERLADDHIDERRLAEGADLTATMTALGRAQVLAEAQRVAAQDQAREQNRRFLKAGRGYVPTPITMFRD
ncbi:hypothetical protein [Sandaracinobacteroides saxicola]